METADHLVVEKPLPFDQLLVPCSIFRQNWAQSANEQVGLEPTKDPGDYQILWSRDGSKVDRDGHEALDGCAPQPGVRLLLVEAYVGFQLSGRG